MGWVVNATPRPFYPTPSYRNGPVSIVQEAGWAPGMVWTGAENLASIWIRSPNRPARNESLFQPTTLAKAFVNHDKSCEEILANKLFQLGKTEKIHEHNRMSW